RHKGPKTQRKTLSKTPVRRNAERGVLLHRGFVFRIVFRTLPANLELNTRFAGKLSENTRQKFLAVQQAARQH
ncbi:MAG: hypothetical protein J6E31_03545, partial [Pyramidobacter sp.]|nr:hypothetical protein [Pyramidobacter sp.]